jgi:hypothetical protein
MSTAEYPPTPQLQRIWSPADARDTVRDTMQLAALKRLHRDLTHGADVWDTLVLERSLLRTLPQPVVSMTPISKLLELVEWPARIVCPVIVV